MKKAKKGKPQAKAIKDDQLKNVAGGLLTTYKETTAVKLDTTTPNLNLTNTMFKHQV